MLGSAPILRAGAQGMVVPSPNPPIASPWPWAYLQPHEHGFFTLLNLWRELKSCGQGDYSYKNMFLTPQYRHKVH